MRHALAVAAMLALAGCADSGDIMQTVVPRQPAQPSPPPAAASTEPTPAERAAAALGRQPAADATVAALPPRVGPDPARLAGMVPAQLTDMLGQPSLRRREKEAEVWMYSSRLCVMHLFLYPGTDGGALGVKHVEMRRPNSATPVAPRDCLDSVIAARKKA
jgi:hypothetical protein